MRSPLALIPLTILLAAGAARADAIDSDWRPPVCEDELECPEGSSPASLGHSSCPSVCRPNAECQSDAECGEGGRCVPTRFCIVIAASGPGMSESVADACEPSGPCGTGAAPSGDPPRCAEVSRCVPPPAPREAAPARGGCAGCVVAPRASAGLAPLAIAILAIAHRRRRS